MRRLGWVVAAVAIGLVAGNAPTNAAEIGLDTYFNNVGVSRDPISGADFDGVGGSYSALALQLVGVEGGTTVSADGFDFTWPDKGSGVADNAISYGQTVPVTLEEGDTEIGFLTAANHGPSPANVVLNYTFVDEFGVTQTSKQTVPIVVSDWTLNGGGVEPSADNTIALEMPFRMLQNAVPDPTATYAFVVSVPVDTTKTLVSVKLPIGQTGIIHMFGIATK